MAATVPSQAPGKFLVGFVFYLCGIPPHPAPKDVPDEKYTRKVIAVLGGQCSDRLTDSVNCCLVKRVGASGYNAVRQCKAVQQLTPQWLYDCYKKNVLLPFQAYHVKPFHGLVIVCSQVTKDERERAQSTIKEHGGTFGAGLEKDKCTHLVAATPDGQKYNYAKSWGNVQIVTLAWIDECVRQKRWVPEIDFPVRVAKRKIEEGVGGERERERGERDRGDRDRGERERGDRGEKLERGERELSEREIGESLRGEREERGRGSGEVKRVAFEVGEEGASRGQGIGDRERERGERGEMGGNLVQVLEECLLREQVGEEAEALCRLAASPGRVDSRAFVGEKFWINGYEAKLRDILVRCIVAGGGTRSMVLCDSVTKVVVGDRADASEFLLVKRHPCGVPVVNVLWVLEQLFSLHNLLLYLRKTQALGGFFDWLDRERGGGRGEGMGVGCVGGGDSVLPTWKTPDSMDDLCVQYARYRAGD